jgi:nucleotide-binding universal stress UspA family protein
MFKHILFPTDGSPHSGVALTKAAMLAKLLGSKLTAIYVTGAYHPAYESEGFLMPEMKTLRKRFDEEETARANKILEEVKKLAGTLGVECASVIATSDVPYRTIIEQAGKSGCDLIVMASHGRRGLEGVLLGSETQKVLTHSKIPVLVCR